MMAGCTNVQTYAGAQVFYWVGFNGIGYILNVFMADTSSLENRAIAFAFSTTPYIGTTFAGPHIAQRFYEESSWQWGHGVWAIIMPFACIPFLFVLFKNQNKAKKIGAIDNTFTPVNRTFGESVAFWFWEFDVIGIILVMAGFILILLPMSLANYQRNTWHSATVICMIVFGVLSLVLFGLYERFGAKKSFIPWELLKDRTILGACGLSATLFVSFYCWDAYYSSYLQIVHDLNIQNAGYVYNTYNIGSCFFGILVAIFIKYTRRFKYLTMCFATPVYIMATGLMIHFRQPDTPIGYVVMCQILIAVAGGTFVLCEQLAVMATATQENVPGVLAFIGLFSSIGGGIGAAISGAIWTNTLPKNLQKMLPEDAKPLYLEIYSSLTVAKGYPIGSAERTAINAAYGATQRLMVIAATCIIATAFVWVGVWKDIKLAKSVDKSKEDRKGTLF